MPPGFSHSNVAASHLLRSGEVVCDVVERHKVGGLGHGEDAADGAEAQAAHGTHAPRQHRQGAGARHAHIPHPRRCVLHGQRLVCSTEICRAVM